MTALFRLGLMILVIEAIFFALIYIYLRSTRRESLEEEWDRRHPERAGPSEERREFVRRSTREYSRAIRKPLIFLVMVLPMVAIMTIIVFVNYR